MLQHQHIERRYKRLHFQAPTASPSAGRVLEQVGARFVEGQSGLGDSEESTLPEVLARSLDRRDDLAYRKLRGEPLTLRETLLLAAMNAVLSAALPAPEPLPEDVLMALEEVERFSRSR